MNLGMIMCHNFVKLRHKWNIGCNKYSDRCKNYRFFMLWFNLCTNYYTHSTETEFQ